MTGLLDREFVSAKHRSLSLQTRFPHTLSAENLEQIRVAVDGESIVGALCIRMFDWIAGRQTWRGAMIGMVWVAAGRRGEGIGTRLLGAAGQYLRGRQADFGVLWTGRPEIYERAGWRPGRGELLADAVGTGVSEPEPAVCLAPLAAHDAAGLEQIRASRLETRVARNAIDYQTIPIPAQNVLCLSANGDGGAGFALLGLDGGTGYFYEMTAPPACWGPLWSAALERCGQIWVNGAAGDPFAEWLAGPGQVRWQRQQKTMWLPLSARVNEAVFQNWHIPYFDWI